MSSNFACYFTNHVCGDVENQWRQVDVTMPLQLRQKRSRGVWRLPASGLFAADVVVRIKRVEFLCEYICTPTGRDPEAGLLFLEYEEPRR